MKKMRLFAILAILALVASVAQSDTVFPAKGWVEKPNPFASPDAYPGGEIRIFGGPYPKSLNYYLDNNAFSAQLFTSMYESLLSNDPVTGDLQPNVAEKWSVSDDKMTFTFWIDPKAKWSDGKPITAQDVKWTFDAILDPKNLTGPFKVSLERLESPTVVDDHTIRFHAKELHWMNLDTVAGMSILPKHVYGKKDFNLINFEFPVISGPYRLGVVKEGISIALERRADWWRIGYPSSKGTGNFGTMIFRVYEEQENAYDAFKKGEIDLYPVYTSRIWMQETQGKSFENNWIVKQRVHNFNPIGFQGFAMNMRKPPFDDVKVRRAMANLIDRNKINTTMMYNQYFLHKSYFEDLYNAQHPCPREPIPFDKDAARKLLAEAGWKANPKTGILEKGGLPFRFAFLTRDASSAKYLAVYTEDLKDVGIEMTIDQKDASAWSKDMDNFQFQMTWAAWSSGIRKDPEDMWHSKEAKRVAGNNYTGFSSPEVDASIEKQRAIFDKAAQEDVVRQIDQLVCEQCPYVLLWNADYTRLLYWNKFGVPPTVLGKYGDERAAYWYWWADEDNAADLKDAMDRGTALSAKSSEVYFDKVYTAKP
jgi:microcin C transport system substrate-binding protein